MSYGKVEICGVNTAELSVLDDEEKQELLNKTKGGDMEARQRLICGNLKLVLSVIQRFIGKRDNGDDIFQVGCIGLMKAIDNFNLTLGVKFSTYAVPMIIGEVRRYLRDNSPLKISRSLRDLAYRAMVARDEIQACKNGDVTQSEIAEKLCEKKEDVSMALDAIIEPISIYEPIASESGDSLYVIDKLSDTSSSGEDFIEKIALLEALKKLTGREKRIIDLRYYKNKTQSEVAEMLGISQAQISRIERNALAKMKKNMT